MKAQIRTYLRVNVVVDVYASAKLLKSSPVPSVRRKKARWSEWIIRLLNSYLQGKRDMDKMFSIWLRLYQRQVNMNLHETHLFSWIVTVTGSSACGYAKKQEAHGPHRSLEKTVQINKHIWLYQNVDYEKKNKYDLFH